MFAAIAAPGKTAQRTARNSVRIDMVSPRSLRLKPHHHAGGGGREQKARAAAGRILDQDIEKPVRPLDHVAHAAKFLEQWLLSRDTAALRLQPEQLLARQRRDEEAVLPSRITIA